MPDLAQVPEPGAGVVAVGLVAVVAGAGRDGVDLDDPGPLAGDPGETALSGHTRGSSRFAPGVANRRSSVSTRSRGR